MRKVIPVSVGDAPNALRWGSSIDSSIPFAQRAEKMLTKGSWRSGDFTTVQKSNSLSSSREVRIQPKGAGLIGDCQYHSLGDFKDILFCPILKDRWIPYTVQ